MSALYEPAFADPRGGLMRPSGISHLLAAGTVVPSDATAGYQNGCIFFHTDGTAGDAVYVNDGTATSCDFNPISSGGAAVIGDDSAMTFGSVATLMWETADANANAMLFQLPAGGVVDVPVIVVGQSIVNVDLAKFDGIVDPTLVMLGHGAVATSPSLRFYKARGTNTAPTVVTSADDIGSVDFYGCVAAAEYVKSARIYAETVGTIATTRGPGAIYFQTATDAAPSVLTTAMTLGAAQECIHAGAVYLNDTTNVDITLGMTLNQGAADNQIFAVKSSDVAHGMTTIAETDTYGYMAKNAATEGALLLGGLGEAQQGLVCYGYAGTADGTDAPTTTSEAIVEIRTAIANGTGIQASAATGNIFQVMNTTTNEFIVKGDGEIYSNQSATVGTFDAHDDGVLCADLANVLSNEYGKLVSYNRQMLEAIGFLGPQDENGQGMYSLTKAVMLSLCGVAQMGRRIEAICNHVGLKLAPNGETLALGQ